MKENRSALFPITFFHTLLAAYGQPRWWSKKPYWVMFQAVLVQNTTWANVEKTCAAIGGRLRPEVRSEDCEDAFILACAWLALAGLAAGETGGGRFTAGEVTIQEGDGAARAAALRLQAETVLGPWLADRGFAFQGVPG